MKDNVVIALTAAATCTLLVVVVVVLGGCEGNTTCTTGDHLCTNDDGSNFEGDPFHGGGTQLRVCSNDEGKGGDEDGEFVVDKNCGGDNQVCFEDVSFDEGSGGANFDGCITEECGAANSPCVDDGASACLLNALFHCGAGATAGCLTWTSEGDCAAGTACGYDESGVAACR